MKYLLFVLVFIACNSAPQESKTINEQYPYSWRQPNNNEMILVGRILVANSISGCGEYEVKGSKADEYSLLVGCTRDGTNWNYYKVSLSSETVEPISDLTIKAPR